MKSNSQNVTRLLVSSIKVENIFIHFTNTFFKRSIVEHIMIYICGNFLIKDFTLLIS